MLKIFLLRFKAKEMLFVMLCYSVYVNFLNIYQGINKQGCRTPLVVLSCITLQVVVSFIVSLTIQGMKSVCTVSCAIV